MLMELTSGLCPFPLDKKVNPPSQNTLCSPLRFMQPKRDGRRLQPVIAGIA